MCMYACARARAQVKEQLEDVQRGGLTAELAEQGARFLEASEARASEQRIADCLEWKVGRMHVASLVVSLNGQRLALGPDGWTMRAFVGTEAQLKGRVMWGGADHRQHPNAPALGGQLGLCSQVLKDSGEAVAKSRSDEFKQHVEESVAKVSGAAAELSATLQQQVQQTKADAERTMHALAGRAKETHEKLARGLLAGAKEIDTLLDMHAHST